MPHAGMKRNSKATPSFVEQSSIELTEAGRRIVEKRFLRRGSDGEPIESVAELFWRVSRHIAEPEEQYGGDPRKTARAFYELLASLRFLPNTPAFLGAGTPLGQLAACFVLPVEDDMGRAPGGIFQTLRDAALIQQAGGGNGFSFSRIRPKGDFVSRSGGIASGPVGFLKVFDAASTEISRGGTGRGANMAVLRVDHPDIEEFIDCKSEEGALSSFNVSVAVTDEFMEAVETNDTFDLVNPRDGSVWRTVDASCLFDHMAERALANGEPGILFLDTANRSNPLPDLCTLEATNPCGEQWLCPYENCCLGSINLARHVTPDDDVDWDMLCQTVELGTHFLDNVIDANAYVPAVPQLKEAALRARRIGLGITGLADLVYRLDIRYGSTEAEELAAQIMEFVRYHSMLTSIALAGDRGPFSAIEGSIYDAAELAWAPPEPLTPYSYPDRWSRPALDWPRIVSGIRKHGIRNASQTTVAPTGTVSIVAGCEGYGCEPVYALAYTRNLRDGDDQTSMQFRSPLFEQALSRAGLDHRETSRIREEVLLKGTCQHIYDLPEQIREAFVVALDISPSEHVRMQASLQAFVDASISKTINLPPSATKEDIKLAYAQAWKLGCKGLAAYVTESREKAVLETSDTCAPGNGRGTELVEEPPGYCSRCRDA